MFTDTPEHRAQQFNEVYPFYNVHPSRIDEVLTLVDDCAERSFAKLNIPVDSRTASKCQDATDLRRDAVLRNLCSLDYWRRNSAEPYRARWAAKCACRWLTSEFNIDWSQYTHE